MVGGLYSRKECKKKKTVNSVDCMIYKIHHSYNLKKGREGGRGGDHVTI